MAGVDVVRELEGDHSLLPLRDNTDPFAEAFKDRLRDGGRAQAHLEAALVEVDGEGHKEPVGLGAWPEEVDVLALFEDERRECRVCHHARAAHAVDGCAVEGEERFAARFLLNEARSLIEVLSERRSRSTCTRPYGWW